MILETIQQIANTVKEAFVINEEELQKYDRNSSNNIAKVNNTTTVETKIAETRKETKELTKKQKALVSLNHFYCNYFLSYIDPLHIPTRNLKNFLVKQYGQSESIDYKTYTRNKSVLYYIINSIYTLWVLLTLSFAAYNTYNKGYENSWKHYGKVFISVPFHSNPILSFLTLATFRSAESLTAFTEMTLKNSATSQMETYIVKYYHKLANKFKYSEKKQIVINNINNQDNNNNDNNHNDNESNNHPTRSNDQDIPVNNQSNGNGNLTNNNNGANNNNDENAVVNTNSQNYLNNQNNNNNNNNNSDNDKKKD